MSTTTALVDQLYTAIGLPQREAIVDLGGCLVRLRLDRSSATVLDRFDLVLEPDNLPVDFEVSCCSPEIVPAQLRPSVTTASARTARGRNLQRGYYATDNFGPPAAVVVDGSRFVVIADHAERVVWSWLVKYLLLRWGVAHDALFLKGAAVERDGRGILLVARGGGGKTTMAMALAGHGARFLANSHVLVSDGIMTGVQTSMRVRESHASARGGSSERLVRPSSMYSVTTARQVPLSLVCVVSRTAGIDGRIERLSPAAAMAVLVSFASGLEVYRLEEDLLDDLNGEYDHFALVSERIRTHVRAIVQRCPVLLVDHDVLRPGGPQAVAEVLWDASHLPL